MTNNDETEVKKVATEIKIKMTMPVIDDKSIDTQSLVEVTIDHEDCGNEKLDTMADNFCRVLTFFVEQLKAKNI
jgi:hypothetical protein